MFVSWIDYLEELKVKFMYDECFDSDVDAWIGFSVKSKVKKLSLIVVPYSLLSSWNNFYTLPQMMYSCSSLTTLHLSRCIMASERKIEWHSLTMLFLNEVKLNQHLMDEIVSNCPALYELVLDECWGFDRLEANSRCLSHLQIDETERECYVEISAPYVCELGITSHAQKRKCQLKNIPSVVRACIDFFEFEDDCTEEVMSNVKEFLEDFKHVKELLVGRQCFEVLSAMAVNGWQFPQSRLQHLTLTFRSEYKHAISGIIGLLESSPELETLILEGSETEGDIVDMDPDAKSDLDVCLLHLKTIRINNFADPDGEPLLTLTQILLKKTPVLEEMLILIDVEDTKDYINIAETLLTYPRSSTKAEIHLGSHE